MSRHIADRDHASHGDAVLKHFVRIERNKKPNKAAIAAQRKAQDRVESARLRAFRLIDKSVES